MGLLSRGGRWRPCGRMKVIRQKLEPVDNPRARTVHQNAVNPVDPLVPNGIESRPALPLPLFLFRDALGRTHGKNQHVRILLQHIFDGNPWIRLAGDPADPATLGLQAGSVLKARLPSGYLGQA